MDRHRRFSLCLKCIVLGSEKKKEYCLQEGKNKTQDNVAIHITKLYVIWIATYNILHIVLFYVQQNKTQVYVMIQ